MWARYKESVEPLIKVLHIPSMDRLFQTLTKRTGKLSSGNQTLVFSIYYSVITSMEDEDVSPCRPFFAWLPTIALILHRY